MPGEASNTFTKFLFWHTALITDGDFSALGLDVGQMLPSSDVSGEAELATDESADGPVGVGADLPGLLFRVEITDAAAITTLQTAKQARTQGYFYAISPDLAGYTAYGPGRVTQAYAKGRGTERQLPHTLIGFTARGVEPEDLVQNYEVAVTLP